MIRVERHPTNPALYRVWFDCESCWRSSPKLDELRGQGDPEWSQRVLARLGGVRVRGGGRFMHDQCRACAAAGAPVRDEPRRGQLSLFVSGGGKS